VKGGDIQQSGARAAPRAPAALTYTAPQQAWSPSDPPGFDVVKAKSRAGAFMREHASEDEYRWLLQPGLKLVIHNKWEAQTPLGFLLSEATFPIELAADANGNLSGQAVVARTRRQREALAGFACQETGEWTETWRAQAAFDDTGEMLTIKITYQSSPKQVRVVCPKVAPKEYTQPGVARQTATPLDNFTMPADEGATKQFVFSAAGTTTNLIDVTVARAEDGGH
jgi:hypothetical protein